MARRHPMSSVDVRRIQRRRPGLDHVDECADRLPRTRFRDVRTAVPRRGIHFNIRLEDDRLCTLVMLGVRSDGTKELVAIEDGYRESTESWSSVLRDLRRRGLRAPVLAVGDGALGFWSAVRDLPQRPCTVSCTICDWIEPDEASRTWTQA